MDACFTKQLINGLLIIALCVIGFSFETVEKGIKLYQEEQRDIQFNFFKDEDSIEQLCSCYISTFNLACRYCPDELFCNKQKSGCCLLRGSDNKCGNYCVPPKYTCCNNNGACGENYPTCCNEHCCGKHNDCCGKNCCSENWKCCEKDKNKHVCILEQTSPGYCLDDSCVKQNENNEFEYFSELCSVFAKETRLQNVGKSFQQFAVLTLNKVSESNESPNKYYPFPIVFNIEQQEGNYVSAAPKYDENKKQTEHAEERIFKDMKTRIERFERDNPNSIPNPPTIYLFTFLSPCPSCVEKIISVKNQYIKGAANMFVGWQLTYQKMKQGDFLRGLEKMMKEKITIVYSPDKLCAAEMSGPPLVQPTLLKDLLVQYKSVKFCENEIALRSSFVKLINLLVWECKFVFDVDGKEKTKNNVINCMTQQIDKLHPKINPCIDLSETITKSITNLFESKNGNSKLLLLSPPLDPESEKTSISNRLTDLTADYKSPYFCFQVLYKSVKG